MASAKPDALKGKDKGKEKPQNEGRQYLEYLVNASAQTRTWKMVSMMMLVLMLALLWALVRTTQTLPVRLVPYEFSLGGDPVEIGPRGEGAREYLGLLAEADLKLFTDWTPDTVERRFKALGRRMTPILHARQYLVLEQEAKGYTRARYHQVFHVASKQAIGDDKIKLDGILVRFSGQTQVMSQPVSYMMEYTWDAGMPMLNSIYPLDSRGKPTQGNMDPDARYMNPIEDNLIRPNVDATAPSAAPATSAPTPGANQTYVPPSVAPATTPSTEQTLP